jgi:hypothetical protein
MAEAIPTAQQIADRYMQLCYDMAARGVKSVMVDGQSVTYEDAKTQWQFWANKAAVAAGTRPRTTNIRLTGF